MQNALDLNIFKTVFVLGRQPELGIAELESKCDNSSIIQFNSKIALSDRLFDSHKFANLGGSIKLSKIISISPIIGFDELENYISKHILSEILALGEGKINFGISVYGIFLNPKQITSLSFSIKKMVKKNGRSIRIVPNQTDELSSAQLIHNKLTADPGFELVIASNNSKFIFARTYAVQDIYGYAMRDQQRPKRDAKIGMLPPKLAQLMINLANPKAGSTVLDPFCGTGVILQEALLMGFPVYGSDINPRMINYTNDNLTWLSKQFQKIPLWETELANAISHNWDKPFNSVVSETYLGKPLSKLPPFAELKKDALEINTLIENFLVNLRPQIIHKTRICIAIPAWRLDGNYFSLPLLDHLEKIGYNMISFKVAEAKSLIYHRPQQLVARQLLVLTRN